MSCCIREYIHSEKSFNQNELTAQQPLNGEVSSLKVIGHTNKYTKKRYSHFYGSLSEEDSLRSLTVELA